MPTKNTIVAVGGTGTHVVIAFLRMAILSNMAISDVPNVVVVDADTAAAGPDDSLMAAAKQLFDQVVSGSDPRSRPNWHHFVPYRATGDDEDSVAAQTQFGDYLLAQPRRTATVDDRQILDSLFTRPTDRTNGEPSEQEILIRDGFSARPSVGATAMYDLLADTHRKLGVLPATLRSLIKGQGYSGVSIVGSSSGGTGSGAGPALAQWLQNEIEKAENQAAASKLGLFMTLPWFFPDETPSESVEPPAGTRENQRLNSAAGIRLYQQSPTLDKAGVFLADYFGIQTIRANDGNARQRENPHPMPLILASQIQNFFLAAEQSTKDETFLPVRGEFTFFNLVRDNAAAVVVLDAKNSPLLAFSRQAEVRQDLHDWAVETQSVRLILQELASFIELDYHDHASSAVRSRPDEFKALMLQLARAKFSENGITKAGGLLGKFGAKDLEIREVRTALSKAIRQRELELTESIDWLSKVELNSEANGRKTLKLDPHAIEVRLHPTACQHFPVFAKGKDPKPVVNAVFEKAFDLTSTEGTEAPATQCVRFFEELIKTDGIKLDPDTAAVFAIERQIRALMQKGQQQRINVRKVDMTKSALPAGLSAQYMLPLQAGERPLNQYLAKIEIAKLVDVSHDRAGARIENYDPGHPFTVTGLMSRAIPSPWAAAHRQAWDRLHGDAQHKALARQSVEAVMWGIFTKRLLLKRLDIQRTRLGRMLKGSLESELHHSGIGGLTYILVAVNAAAPEDVVATNQPNVAWFVAPWLLEEATKSGQPAWWRLPKFGWDLPSELVRGTWSPDDFMLRQVRSFVDALMEVRRFHAPDANASRSLDIPWYLDVADLISALEPAVLGVTPVPQRTGQSGEQMMLFGRDRSNKLTYSSVAVPVLRQSLHEILNSYVPPMLASIELPESVAVGGVRHPDLPVYARYVHEVQACVGPMQVSASGETFLLRYELTLRGLGKAIVEVASHKVLIGAYLGIFPNFKADSWRRYMLGCTRSELLKEDYRFSALSANGAVLGESMRSFGTNHMLDEAPHYIVLHADSPEDANELKGEVGCFNTRLAELEPRSLAFRLGLDIGTSHSCFFPTEKESDHAIPDFDFTKCGRDLTQVMLSEDHLLNNVVESTLFLGVHSSAIGGSERRVLPSELKVQFRKGGPAPAVLLGSVEPARHFTPLPYEYSVPASSTKKGQPGEFLTDFKWSETTSGAVYHGLRNTDFHANQPQVLGIYLQHLMFVGFAMLRKRGYQQLDVLRATFPEAFNTNQLITYADKLVEELRISAQYTGVTVNLKVAPKGETPVERSLDQLRGGDLMPPDEETQGILVQTPHVEQSCLVSESLAAVCANPLDRGDNHRGITLVLDMGGGTTDIALFAFAGDHEEHKALDLASITDSIQYAGNDVLTMLNSDQVFQRMAKAVNPIREPEKFSPDDAGARERMLLIRRLMRNPVAMNAVKAAMLNGQLPTQVQRVSAFFDGLTAYASLLAKAYQARFERDRMLAYWNVNVILLGNGWRLTDLIYDNGNTPAKKFLRDLEKEIKKELNSDRVEVKAVYKTNESVSVKEAIAFGALRVHDYRSNLAQISTKAFVAAVPLKVMYEGEKIEVASINVTRIPYLADELVLPNRVEVNLEHPLFAARLRKRYLELIHGQATQEGRVMANLAGELNREFAEVFKKRRGSKETVKLSPFGLFLERFWKEACLKH